MSHWFFSFPTPKQKVVMMDHLTAIYFNFGYTVLAETEHYAD